MATDTKAMGRAKSCVVCRQFKLACDARKTAPDPCSRCVSKNLKCRFDPNFKRIATRRIAQEVADEIHTLRAAQYADSSGHSEGTPHSHQILSGPQSPTDIRENIRASVSSGASQNELQSLESTQKHWLQLPDEEIVLNQSIHGVTIPASRILTLFYHFQRYYFPHARFLSNVTSVNGLAKKSPLLFWTILVIAAERYEGGSDGLYEQLCGAHDILIAEILHKAIMHLEVVHALLLLCHWPIPKLRNAYDPSWNYLALAISAACTLNCHSPLGKNDVTAHYRAISDTSAAEMEPPIQGMTWITCYEMGVRLSGYLGLPPPLSKPQHSRTIRNSQKLATDILTPADLATLSILDVLCTAQIHMSVVEDAAAHFSMTEMYIQQLDAIQVQYQDSWSWSLDVQMESAKVNILGITLTLDPPEQLSEGFLYRQVVLEKGMKAASYLISAMMNLSNQSIPGHRYASGILTFYPKYYFISMMSATAYLFRFLISYQGATSVQQSSAIQLIAESHKIFQSFPDHRDAVRACINIESFVNVIRHNPTTSSISANELVIKNRLGASVMHDAVFRAAQHRNRHPVNGSNVPVAQWKMMIDIQNGHRMPLAPEQKFASPPSQAWMTSSNELQQQDSTAWMGLWDAYSNEFGVMTEPWVQQDAEFSMAELGPQPMYGKMPSDDEYIARMTSAMGN